MADLINFVTLLNGKFDNKDQFEKISKTNPQYPYAKHINKYVIPELQISQMVSKAYL